LKPESVLIAVNRPSRNITAQTVCTNGLPECALTEQRTLKNTTHETGQPESGAAIITNVLSVAVQTVTLSVIGAGAENIKGGMV